MGNIQVNATGLFAERAAAEQAARDAAEQAERNALLEAEQKATRDARYAARKAAKKIAAGTPSKRNHCTSRLSANLR